MTMSTLNSAGYETKVAEILALARKHGMESRVTIPPSGNGPQYVPPYFNTSPDLKLVTLHFHTDPEAFPTVDKLASLVMSMNPRVDWISVVDKRPAAAPKDTHRQRRVGFDCGENEPRSRDQSPQRM